MSNNSLQIENVKLKIVFFGTPDFVIPTANSITDNFELVGVVTPPDTPAGRKKIVTPSPIKKWYMDYLLSKNKEGVILTPDQLNEDTAIKLRKLHPDLFVVASYGKLVPENILNIPTLGSLNIHPSFLPKYRGSSPIQTAILNGDQTLGISLIQMDDKLDHGPIVAQWEIPIEHTDTFESLHRKSFTFASRKLPDVIEKITKKSLTRRPQNHTSATFTQKITKQDGYFDIDNPPDPEKLNRMIRAYYPWPAAWTRIHLGGGRLKQSGRYDSREVEKEQKSRIMKFLPDGFVQMEGKKPVKMKELLNGYPEMKETLKKLSGSFKL